MAIPVYQQKFVDSFNKVAFQKLYTTKTPLTATDVHNDKVIPFGVLQTVGVAYTEYFFGPLSRVLWPSRSARLLIVFGDQLHRPDNGESYVAINKPHT